MEETANSIELYAQKIADRFTTCSEENATFRKSAEELLLKWCSEPPSADNINTFILSLKECGIEAEVVTNGSEIELIYLLKEK